MSDTASSPPAVSATPEEISEKLADRWGWFIALGIIFVILGTIGLGMVGFLSVVSVIYIAALLLIGGAVQIFHAFRERAWRSSLLHIAGAVLYIIAGVLLVLQPGVGLLTITLVVGLAIGAVGATRIIIGFQHRPDPGWGWLTFSGVVGVLLGLLIILGWPSNAIWVLGLLVAIELLMEGWGMVLMGFALRRWKNTGGTEAPA